MARSKTSNSTTPERNVSRFQQQPSANLKLKDIHSNGFQSNSAPFSSVFPKNERCNIDAEQIMRAVRPMLITSSENLEEGRETSFKQGKQ